MSSHKNSLFMLVYMSKRPAPGQDTSKKGWGETGEWQVGERAIFVDKVNNKDLINAHTVIDVFNRKCLRTRYTDATGDKIVEHFLNAYPKDVEKAIGNYLQRQEQSKKSEEK